MTNKKTNLNLSDPKNKVDLKAIDRVQGITMQLLEKYKPKIGTTITSIEKDRQCEREAA